MAHDQLEKNISAVLWNFETKVTCLLSAVLPEYCCLLHLRIHANQRRVSLNVFLACMRKLPHKLGYGQYPNKALQYDKGHGQSGLMRHNELHRDSPITHRERAIRN